MIGAEFAAWARRQPQRIENLYPWLSAARGILCGWCNRPLGDCLCFGPCAPAEPARPIDVAAYLASIPKWCRICRGTRPCGCAWPEIRLTYQRRYTAKAKARGRCVRCTGPAPDDGGALCETCLVLNRKTQTARRQRREALGLCARCGAADHASATHYTRIKQAILDRGGCITCGEPRGEGRRQCQPCRHLDAERHRAKRAAASSAPLRTGLDSGAGPLDVLP